MKVKFHEEVMAIKSSFGSKKWDCIQGSKKNTHYDHLNTVPTYIEDMFDEDKPLPPKKLPSFMPMKKKTQTYL